MKQFLLLFVLFGLLVSTNAQTSFVQVEGGTFKMGQPDPNIGGNGWSLFEQPVHTVTLSSFNIGKYEVTQKEWVDLMGSNPSYSGTGIGDNYPVNNVSWYEILVYCNKLSIKEGKTPCYSIGGSTNPADWGSVPTTSDNSTWNAATCNWSANGYRLPTEEEWEYAARGGNKSAGYTYSGSNNIDEVAWYEDNSGTKNHAVGTKKANELGIYDMTGNVWEWSWDWYRSYSSSSQANPKGPNTGPNRIFRGGSWYNSTYSCRVAFRSYTYPYDWFSIIGFRLVRSL